MRAPVLNVFLIACPLDAKIKTARVCIPDVDIGYIPILKKLLQLGFDEPIGNIPLCNESATARIGVESKRVGKHIHRETSALWISFAIALVDEDGTGQRKALFSREGIMGEEYAALRADEKCLQALPAGPVTSGHFSVRRMTIAG